MRILKNLAAAAALASMAATPVIASASGASKLSLRTSTKGKKSNQIAPAVLIGLIATIAIVGGAVVLESGDSN